MGWENQYIQLVTTKPGLILSEEDRVVSQEAVEVISARRKDYQKCFVELGSGSGMHLLKLAERHPEALCIGFEIRFKRAFRTGEKAETNGLSNVVLIRTDARNISSLFPIGSVDGFFVNYPDPWDKRRWLKNRLLNPELLTVMWERLASDGFLRYKTDHQEYFASTMKILKPGLWELTRSTTDLMASEYAIDNIPTEFELLFKSQGKPLCFVEACKNSERQLQPAQ